MRLTLPLLLIASLTAFDLVPLPEPPAASAHLPWVAADASADALAPVWEQSGTVIGANLRAGASVAGIELALVVRDPQHANTGSGKQLWRGDSVYVHADGRGDGRGAVLGVDDVTVLAALGANGPEVQVLQHGRSDLIGAYPAAIVAIARDDAAGCLRYRLRLPWALIGSAPGLGNRLGLAVTVAHKDEAGKDQSWGTSRTPNLLALADPPSGDPVAMPALPLLLVPGGIRVAACPTASAVLEVSLGQQQRSLAWEAGAWGRAVVALDPTDLAVGADTVHLRLRQGGQVVWQAQQSYRNLVLLETAVADRVAVLRRHADPAEPVVTWYLDSLGSCLAQARLQRPFMADRADWSALYGQVLEMLLTKLPAERVDLAQHIRRGMPLVGAFVSQADDVLQFYALQLPYAWQPGTTYPMTVYLHGYGTPYAMGGLGLAYDNRHQDTLFREVDIDPAQVPPLHRGFVLAPWGRGNGFYRGPAGQDVFQALSEVERRFTIDPDRRYLTGFSMGCHGAARLAAYRPDLWAGINLAAGFGDWSDATRRLLRENLRGLPVALWCGELDSMYQGGRRLAEDLRLAGFTVTSRWVPNLPHTYPYDEFNRQVAELQQHRRERQPKRFAFRTDLSGYAGRNGIIMRQRLPAEGGTAGFTCVIDGPTVELHSDGCDGISIDCERLGLTGPDEVVIHWNGKEVYRGKPQQVFVPERFELRAEPDFGLR